MSDDSENNQQPPKKRPLPVINIDNIRSIARPDQLFNRAPIQGLQVVSSETVFEDFDLDEQDPIFQQQPQENGKEQKASDNNETVSQENQEISAPDSAEQASGGDQGDGIEQSSSSKSSTSADQQPTGSSEVVPPNSPEKSSGDKEILGRAAEDNQAVTSQEDVSTAAAKAQNSAPAPGSKDEPSKPNSQEKGRGDEEIVGRATEDNQAVTSQDDDSTVAAKPQHSAPAPGNKDEPSKPADRQKRDEHWLSRYEALRQYKAKHGHTRAPYGYEDENGVKLGVWVANQRSGYSRMKRGLSSQGLDQNRIEKLNELGFEWVVRQPSSGRPFVGGNLSKADLWLSRYEALRRYKEKNGHTRVPLKFVDENGIKLGSWVANQRSAYSKIKQGLSANICLDQERIDKLDAIGFVWSARQTQPNSPASIPDEHSTASQNSESTRPAPQGTKTSRSIDSSSEPDLVGEDSRGRALENELMEKLDREILAAEEKELMEKLDRDILAAEEKELMERLDQEISEAERNAVASRSSCVEFVSDEKVTSADEVLQDLKITWSEATSFSGRRDQPKPIPMEVDILPVVKATKILPKHPEGQAQDLRLFTSSEFHNDLVLPFQKSRNNIEERLTRFRAQLNDVEGDPDSWLLEVHGHRDSVDAFLRELDKWFEKQIRAYNLALLFSRGVQRTVELDSTKPVGVQVRPAEYVRGSSHYRGLLISHPKDDGQLAKAIGLHALKRGAAISLFDSNPCTTIKEFKQYLKGKSGGKFEVVIHLSPDFDVEGGDATPFVSVAQKAKASGGRNADTISGVDETSGEATSSDANLRQPPTGAPSEAEKALGEKVSGFQRFNSKFKDAVVIEYKRSGIHLNFAMGRMWHQHKKRYGYKCADNCDCVFGLPYLTNTVVADQIEKADKNWTNPDRLREGDYPVGFVGTFAGRFLPKLRDEYPDEDPSQLLGRLVGMWHLHRINRMFGVQCSESCDCEQGWELVFRKGALESDSRNNKRKTSVSGTTLSKKRKLQSSSDSDKPKAHAKEVGSSPIPRKRPSQESSAALPVARALIPSRRGASGESRQPSIATLHLNNTPLPRKQRNSSDNKGAKFAEKGSTLKQLKEYDVTFDTHSPLGFYCVTENHEDDTYCKIISVCPRGQAKKDPRIQNGTAIVAVDTDRRTVKTWNDLFSAYFDANKDDRELRLWCVNMFVDAKTVQQAHRFSDRDWTGSNHWQGKCKTGWAGGAQVAGASNSSLMTAEQLSRVVSKFQGLGLPRDVEPSNREQEGQSAVPSSTDWVKTSSVRTISHDRASHSVLKGTAGGVQPSKRKVCFKETVEERRYDVESLPYEFEVKQTDSGPGHSVDSHGSGTFDRNRRAEDKLVDVFRNKTFLDALDLLEDGAMGELRDTTLLDQLRNDHVKERLKLISAQLQSDRGNRGLLVQHRDYEKKDILLKIFINAGECARKARSIKNWSRFEIRVNKIDDIKLKDPLLQRGSSDVYALVSASFPGEPHKDDNLPQLPPQVLSGTNVVYEHSPSYHMRHNASIASQRTLLITLRLRSGSSTDVEIGSAAFRISDLYATCPRDGEWVEFAKEIPSNQLLMRATVNIRARREGLEQGLLLAKRLEECRRLSSVVDWIERFNRDIAPEERKRGKMLSINAPLAGKMTLLHAAIFLEDTTLVDRLMKLGADPHRKGFAGSALSLALNMADGATEKTDVERATIDNRDDAQQLMRRKRRTCLDEILHLLGAQHQPNYADEPIFPVDGNNDPGVAENLPVASGEKGATGNSDMLQMPNVRMSSRILSAGAPDGTTQEPGNTDIVRLGQKRKATQNDSQANYESRRPRRTRTSEETPLPFLASRYWLTDPRENRQLCKNFNKKGSCKFGPRCHFLHEQKPLGQLLWQGVEFDRVPPATITQEPSFDTFRKFESAYDSLGTRWVTAGYRNNQNLIFYAEGGETGRRSDQKVWWYPSEMEAEKALKRVMDVATMKRSKGMAF